MMPKTNGLYKLTINHFLSFALACIAFSCNTNLGNKNNQVTTDSLQENITTNIDTTTRDINLADTIRNLMTISLLKDTFEYRAFYNENNPYSLLYFKTGNLFNPKIKHAITLYSINDTTVMCELYYLADDKWTNAVNSLSMHINGFSPAYFNVWIDDYNFDGDKDLYVNFYQSMSVAYSYGYILTFNRYNNSMTLHPETIDFPNLEIDKKSKTLNSTVYSNPNIDTENFKIIGKYSWINGTLQLISKKKISSNKVAFNSTTQVARKDTIYNRTWGLSREINSYDVDSNKIETIYQKQENELKNWKTTSKHSYTYDNLKNKITQIIYEWNTKNNTYDLTTRLNWGYDNHKNKTGQVLSKWNTKKKVWEKITYEIFKYDSTNNILEFTKLFWIDSAWHPNQKIVNTYNYNHKVMEKIEQKWNYETNAMLNFTKTKFVYDTNGELIEKVTSVWNATENDWNIEDN